MEVRVRQNSKFNVLGDTLWIKNFKDFLDSCFWFLITDGLDTVIINYFPC